MRDDRKTGHIPPEFVEQLLARVDIVEIIDSRIGLRKAGHEYQACCPFHQEKTPSFTVSQNKQFYHCFGCGVHGSALGFLMAYEHLSFVEAVASLARLVGVSVPKATAEQSRLDKKQAQLSTQLSDWTTRAAQYFQTQLTHSVTSLNYLKQREVSSEMVKRFALGYAPAKWDGLLNTLVKQGAKIEQLLQAGLVTSPSSNKTYDRFRDRLIFPIRNREGITIGFGGRIMGEGEPKYLNSPETPLFHKGEELYGLWEMRQHLRKIERVLVVEGYMDVIALAQNDIAYAVATLGTATTTTQVERLYRTCKHIIFCFDGDRAGKEAAWKALNSSLPLMRDGRSAQFLFLPEGEDPDSLIRKEGQALFVARITEATAFSDYFFNHLSENIDLTSIDGRAQLLASAAPLIGKLPDTIFRDLMREELAKRSGASVQTLKRRVKAGAKQIIKLAPIKMARTPIKQAIALILTDPSLARAIAYPHFLDHAQLISDDSQIVGLLASLIATLQTHPELTHAGHILNYFADSDYAPLLQELLRLESPIPKSMYLDELVGILAQIAKREDPKQQLLRRLMNGETLSATEIAQLQQTEST